MLNEYFCPRVVSRLEAGGHAEIICGFLAYLHRRGHARLTVQIYVRQVELFLQWLAQHRRPLRSINEAIVRSFACSRGRRNGPSGDAHAAVRHLLRHLRSAGIVSARPPTRTPAVERILADYGSYLERTCGLAASTVRDRLHYAREFIQSVFGSGRVAWRRVGPRDVQSFIAQYGEDGRFAAAGKAAVSLRGLLRWLKLAGKVSPSLIGAVPHFRRWRMASLPTVMTDDQIRSFLAVFDRSRPSGRRDYAMALCMVDLGLRVTEVADLKLEDVDHTAGTIRLICGKSRRDRVLPMPRRVKQAILSYLRRGRPDSLDSQVFVRHRVPVGVAVTRELVRGVMRRAYARVEGCEDWTGTHALRHTAATRLHRAGADLKCVADILGHLSIDTTAIYAKVDVDRLAEVALPWPSSKETRP